MKITIVIFFYCFFLSGTHSYGQIEDSSTNRIKLFTNSEIIDICNERLNATQRERLFNRITSLINRIGTVDVGYSNYYVVPKILIVDTAGITSGVVKNYRVECEFTIQIMRISYKIKKSDLAIFRTYHKKLFGLGETVQAAVNNAISRIKTDDSEIITFFKKSKIEIKDYYDLYCNDALQEAHQAKKLRQYDKAYALYYSIPYGSPCYSAARDNCIDTYKLLARQECNQIRVRIESYITMALKDNKSADEFYQKAIDLIEELEPQTENTLDCYREISLLFKKIEKRFTADDKRLWQMQSKLITDASEIEKIRAKKAEKINETYVSATFTAAQQQLP